MSEITNKRLGYLASGNEFREDRLVQPLARALLAAREVIKGLENTQELSGETIVNLTRERDEARDETDAVRSAREKCWRQAEVNAARAEAAEARVKVLEGRIHEVCDGVSHTAHEGRLYHDNSCVEPCPSDGMFPETGALTPPADPRAAAAVALEKALWGMLGEHKSCSCGLATTCAPCAATAAIAAWQEVNK